MNRSFPGRQTGSRSVIIGLTVLSFALMTFDAQSSGEGLPGTLRAGAQAVFAPVQRVARSVIDPAADAFETLTSLSGLREENQRLRTENERLRAEVAEAERLVNENELLRQLINLERGGDIPRSIAEVIASTGGFDLSFTINKGLEDGLVVGNPVLDAQGILVGKVIEVFPNQALVQPVIAVDSGVFVETVGGAIGVVSGTGSAERMRLDIFVTDDSLEAGTFLRTSVRADGQVSDFPPGLVVAEVTETVEPEAGLIVTESVRPVADFDRLLFVVVLHFAPQALSDDELLSEEEIP